MANALSTSVCEFRATAGDNSNGGFFDTASGGTDYSNQDNPQLTLADLTTDAVDGTTLSSVTGGFTAAMVGNSIYISAGTGFTVGWYRVTAYTDTNNVTIDRGAGLSATGGTGKLGGALAVWTDAFFELEVLAGMTVYVKNDGTMTITADIWVATDGINTSDIKIEGYNLTRGDSPTLNNRPLIACGVYQFIVDNYWAVFNLRFTGTGSKVIELDNSGKAHNLEVVNSSANINTYGIFMIINNTASVIGCKVKCANGIALYVSHGGIISDCYAYDSKTGIMADQCMVESCVADTCGTGISTVAYGNGGTIKNNTIYNSSTTGIHGESSHATVVINNIIDSCATGITWDSITYKKSNYIDYNNYTNNTIDVTNVTKGANATATDPLFTDAANGDFAIGDTALKGGALVASLAKYTSSVDVGAVQRLEPTAGSGGETSNVSVN